MSRLGILCVVSGPSGSGKTTLCRGLSRLEPDQCRYAVSATTRPPRGGEEDGRDYHFLNEDTFLKRVAEGEFVEWARVHGNLYGTLKSEVCRHIEEGRDVLMDLDVQGGEHVRSATEPWIREALVDVFILPPSRGELVMRLGKRATESEAERDLRLQNALKELQHWRYYRYTLVSGTPEEDLAAFRAILVAERHRTARLQTVPAFDAE